MIASLEGRARVGVFEESESFLRVGASGYSIVVGSHETDTLRHSND